MITQGSHGTGQVVGRAAAADGLPAGDLVSNFKTSFDAQLNVTAEFGGAGDAQTPSVVQTGGCAGDD